MPKMSQTKYLKGECIHCGGRLEFPAEAAGLTADCPHCGQQTDLLLERPKEEPAIPRKTIVWTVIATIILLGGLGAAFIALNLAKNKVARKKEQSSASVAPVVQEAQTNQPPEDPLSKTGFRVGDIKLDKASGSSLVYATGAVTNASNRQRFGVKVELEVLDAAGQKLGAATDYQQSIEAKGTWQFRALDVQSKAASARVAAIKEDQ